MPRFYVTGGRSVGRSFVARAGSVFGRSAECDVSLPDGSVSRRHAALEREGDDWVLVDLDSANGIERRGAKSRRCRLADGDEITLGRVSLRFRVADEPQPPSAPQPVPAARPAARGAGAGRETDATEVVLPRSQRATRERVPTARELREAELARLRGPARTGLFTGDLHQRPWWLRWTLYAAALALTAATTYGAFRLVQLLRGG